MKCAIYCRVSTRDQSVEMQLVQLREYAQRRGWEIADEYIDEAVSGIKKKRPGLDSSWRIASRGWLTLCWSGSLIGSPGA